MAAKVKLFRYERQAQLPYALIQYLRTQGDPMYHSQGEIWVSGVVKADALALLAELVDSKYIVDRPATLRMVGKKGSIYDEALREAGLPEPDEILFAHHIHGNGASLYSMRRGQEPRVRGHFEPLPGRYGARFVKVEEAS